MKIAIIMGTRPEIIRFYHTVKTLSNKTIYWTGQNFEKNLSDEIFNDKILKDAYEDIIKLSTQKTQSFCAQFGLMINELHNALTQQLPDKVLILGDTNSSLAGALVAKKLGLPLYHMEAGNRCYNPESPEEVNRKLIDSITDVHMCYTEQAKKNLLFEGVPQNRIHVIGNPIAEFDTFHKDVCLQDRKHILVTCHRQENEKYIKNLIHVLKDSSISFEKIIACIHPRFNDYFRGYPEIKCIPSVSFSEFIKLQKSAKIIITDSGTICEEAAILRIPCVIIRETMERPELFDYGTCILSGIKNTEDIFNAIRTQLLNKYNTWNLPPEYNYQKVSEKVKNIVLSKGNYI